MSDAGESEPQTWICLGCEAALKPDARFCVRCGTPTGLPPAPPREREEERGELEPLTRPTRRRNKRRKRFDPALRPSEPAWVMLRPALLLFGLFLLSSLILSWMSSDDLDEPPTLDAWITGIDALLILAFVAADWRAIRPLLTGPWSSPRNHLLIVALLATMFVVINAYFWGLTALIGLESYDYTRPFRANGWPPWSCFVLISLCPAVFEELAVRGVIMQRLALVMRPTEVMFLQAALFAIMHLNPLIFVSHFFMGLVLGYARVKTGSLFPGMIIHAVWNGYVVAEAYMGK